jgi:OFA family oxalate/formate antiporter-like MFS transporter
VAAGLLLGSGYLLASVAGDRFLLLWLGVGCLGGLGVACGYYCPVATAVKWFPGHKGLVGGLAVGGYGASAIILTNVAHMLFQRGWQVPDVFRFVGLVYGPIIILMGLLLAVPAGTPDGRIVRFHRRVLLGDRQFWALAAFMFSGTLSGVVVNGNLLPMGSYFHFSGMVALQAITLFAIGSATGRVAGGFAHDRLGGRVALVLDLGLMIAAMVLLIGAGTAGFGWLPAVMFVGFCYGGCLGVCPAQVVDLYGPKVMGTVYAVVMLAHGLAGQIGPFLAGWARDVTGGFVPGLVGTVIAIAAGLVAFAWLANTGTASGRGKGAGVGGQ